MLQMVHATQHIRIFEAVQEARLMNGVVIPKLVHGDTCMYITEAPQEELVCDALVTNNLHLKLGVYTGDCAAVCFGNAHMLAVIHVGWRGLCTNLLEKVSAYFKDAPFDIYVGPHYHTLEFQKDFAYDQIVQSIGADYFERKGEKIFFKFTEALKASIPAHAYFDERDTEFSLNLPSYRRTGEKLQRLITVVESPL